MQAPAPSTTGRSWHWSRARLLIAAAGLASPALQAQTLSNTQLNATARQVDLYGDLSGPVAVVDQQRLSGPWGTNQSVLAQSWAPLGGVAERYGGIAYAKTHFGNGQALVGTSALARNSGGFNGSAVASLTTTFQVTVQIDGPRDPIGQRLWLGSTLAAGCNASAGCQLATSFLHQTDGRFAWASGAGDATMAFNESVTVAANSASRAGSPVSVGGGASVRLANGVAAPTTGFTGGWRASNLTAFSPTPAQDLGLFPGADPRNALPDPAGPLQGFDFFHAAVIEGVLSPFYLVLLNPDTPEQRQGLSGSFVVRIAQSASAGTGADSFRDATLATDFSHTGVFGFGSVSDPGGVLDFAGTSVALAFSSPVPEPAPWRLGLLALPVLGWVLRQRGRALDALHRPAETA